MKSIRRAVAIIGFGLAAVAVQRSGAAEERTAAPARGPLRVLEENPIYFTDGSGKAVYLTGSHTWNNFQDSFKGDQARPQFNYAGYLSFLKERGHNFMRMWTWEGGVNDVRFEPLLYARTDSGKFDLDRFNEAYFERLRARVTAARDLGIYVSVMLFQGWSIYSHGYGNPWPVHPFHAANNVNGIDGDRDRDGEGKEVHSLEVPAVTRLQEAYLKKVIDTVNDLDNVLYEVTNETAIHSKEWQYHIVKYVQEYEKTKPQRHPIGMTAFDSGREGSMDALFRGPADWISPQNDGESGDYQNDPPAAVGRKVIISDTDHLWGVGGGRDWVWKSFTRGHQPIYMDPLEKGDKSDADEAEMEGARKAMGQTRRFAERVALRAMKPAQGLASTRYCLANPGKEYLVYLPEGGKVTVDLSPAKGDVAVEWFDPVKNETAATASVAGGATRELRAPFAGPAVLYLKTARSEQSNAPNAPRPSTRVVSVTPPDGATDVDPRTIAQIHFSTGLKLTTITADAVRLLGPGSSPVPARLGHDIEGDVVNLQPGEPLLPRTAYSVEVTAKLIDKEGTAVQPFSSRFTTGVETSHPVPAEGFRFAKTKVDDEKGPTAIAVGPDGNIYVSTYYGLLHRLRIAPETGLSAGKEQLLTLGGNKILGLAFDPGATPSDLVAWITYDERRAEDVEEGTFSGVLSRVRIPAAGEEGRAVETRYITGLPSGWHPLNGCAFGPDRRLYISVGSMNRLGDDPRRPETPLSAAVLVADVRSAAFNGGKLPLDARTSAPVHYDSSAEGAPLRLFATGFREMYGPCWHSNGSFYGGVNQNDGTGRADTPARAGVPSLRAVFPDEDLVRIVEGAYYGHPNPSRNEYVLLGGNPTAGADPWEIAEYPVGVEPEPGFHPENLIFNLKTINGTSANGCAEYTGPGSLGGRLLVCFYEGTHTIHTFAFSADGKRVTDHRPLLGRDNEAMKFTQPLDIAVHPGGRIYVADFGEWASFGGGGAIWALEAVGGAEGKPPAAAETEGFIDSGGVKLHYVARGEGPLCVLLHGFPDFSFTWRRQLPELSRRFRAVAIDLRGYNLSDKPEGIESYAMEKLVADVLAVVEHFGAEKAVIAGHDWGGAIAWSFAMSHPERTERLMIFNLPHPKGLMRELATNPLQQAASAYARRFQEPEAAKSLTPEGLVGILSVLTKLDEDEKAKYLEAFRRSSMESMLAYYKANYPRPPYKDDREFPPVKCPVLMFHGLKDPALLPGALNDTWKWVEKDLTLITVPDAGHWVHLDAADRVNRSMMAWLSR